MLQVGSDGMIARYVCYEPFTVSFAHKCEWQREFNPDNKRGLVLYTDGCKTKALVLRCIGGAREEEIASGWAPHHNIPGRHICH